MAWPPVQVPLSQQSGLPSLGQTLMADRGVGGYNSAYDRLIANLAAKGEGGYIGLGNLPPIVNGTRLNPSMLNRTLDTATGLPSSIGADARAGLSGYTGAGLGGAAKTLLGRGSSAIAIDAAAQLAAQANTALGGPKELSSGLSGAGQGAALGTMIAPGPGTVIGGVLGAGAHLVGDEMSDLDTVNSYDSQVDKFNKVLAKLPKSEADQYRHAAIKSHRSDSSYGDKLNYLTALTQDAHALRKSEKTSGKQTKALDQQTARQLAIQAIMARTMNEQAQNAVDLGDASAASIRNSPAYSDPQLQPMLEYDAQTRAAYGRQMQTAYTAATYIQPQIDQMDAQLAQYRQLLQNIQAANSGSGGNNSFSAVLDSSKK